MTTEIALTLLILAAAVVLFITERIRLDLTALLVLVALAITGLVTPAEALSGFSNPAVITVWAVFILSAGLSRTGVADIVGRQMMRVAGHGQTRLLVVIMVTVAVLSAFMNNVGVAAMLLPVVVTISGKERIPPSKLLMPLSVGALLGGMTTLIGTPPNILASNALFDAGLEPFSFFDFTPVGVVLLIAGVSFMIFAGQRLLPVRNPMESLGLHKNGEEESDLYDLEERLVLVAIPEESRLAGKTLSESRIGAALGLTILGVERTDGKYPNMRADSVLESGDCLLAMGKLNRLEELSRTPFLEIEEWDEQIEHLVSPDITLAELVIAEDSPFAGSTLAEIDMGRTYGLHVLVIAHNGRKHYTDLPYMVLEAGDRLLVQSERRELQKLAQEGPFAGHLFPDPPDGALATAYDLQHWLLAARIPEGSLLDGRSLAEDDLPGTFGLSVIAIVRDRAGVEVGMHESSRAPLPVPHADTVLAAGDVVWLKGQPEDLAVVRGLQNLEVRRQIDMGKIELETPNVGLAEAVLAPRSKLFNKTLRETHFRERYGLSVLAVWRNGRAYRSDLGDLPLKSGDALLLYGPREYISLLEQEADFVVVTSDLPQVPARERAPAAVLIMGLFVLTVLMGWLNIAIAAVAAAALMVLGGCLTMEDAYQAIEWRAVFLIACMLPLGLAMESSGTAQFLANGMVGLVGPWGGTAVLAGFFLMTNIASQFMPNPVVTVLMAPIAITTAADLMLSPYALMMVVAIAASASFMSPVGHPANVLVMGPGGYRFADFVKVGIPLTLVVLVITLLVLPIFWPL
jgi:di/tricarboxylate transporter